MSESRPLHDTVAAACARLAPAGWRDLLLEHGLDVAAADLRAELLKPLAIRRALPGFEDFAGEGTRAIEPRRPDRSLLLHAFASPNVLAGASGAPLGAFPTIDEIVAVENLVFGIAPPSLPELAARFPGTLMAVAVFATEYRPGPETVHRRHAELCFARTGVARVGTAPARYDAARRGFLPFDDDDVHGFRVLPARYAPYLAVQLAGRRDLFGPMNFDVFGAFSSPRFESDTTRDFWVPIHKLFSGAECLRGMTLDVGLRCHHVNEKLRRVHRELRRRGFDTGREEPEIDAPPFVFSDAIAELDPGLGAGIVAPVPHPLVEEAKRGGETIDFVVPAIPDNGFAPSLTIASVDAPGDQGGGFRHAPEYVHVRHVVGPNGREDLNDDPAAADRVRAGGYRAVHYVDHSGDGSVVASCPQLAVQVPRNVPAYSVVTAPDFYPNCDQRELMEWWQQRVPSALRNRVWGQALPLTLADERIAPNIELPDVDFRAEDTTVTAIVSLPLDLDPAQRALNVGATMRHAHLPDGASGVFAPGWDTSRDITDGVAHLAGYGLGSPFPEDAKLCAALSSFWPAVAPDAGRSFSAPFLTTTPLTDEEIGSAGSLPWDGVAGPAMVTPDVVEYASFDFVDYVQSALDARFTLALTGVVDIVQYEARVLAAVRAHLALGIADPRNERNWRVLSFLTIDDSDAELVAAQTEAGGAVLAGPIFRLGFGRLGAERVQSDHRRARFPVAEHATLFAGAGSRLLVKRAGRPWRAVVTR